MDTKTTRQEWVSFHESPLLFVINKSRITVEFTSTNTEDPHKNLIQNVDVSM